MTSWIHKQYKIALLTSSHSAAPTLPSVWWGEYYQLMLASFDMYCCALTNCFSSWGQIPWCKCCFCSSPEFFVSGTMRETKHYSDIEMLVLVFFQPYILKFVYFVLELATSGSHTPLSSVGSPHWQEVSFAFSSFRSAIFRYWQDTTLEPDAGN